MGTYTKLILRKKNQSKKVNELLKKLGAEYETFEGVEYGMFFTQEMVNEDIRFMNEDPEGLDQNLNYERPISEEDYWKMVCNWREIATYKLKISCPNDEESKNIEILKQFLNSDDSEKYIDYDKSENLDRLINY